MSETAPGKLAAAGLLEDETPEAAAEYYAEIRRICEQRDVHE